ncbi:LOW QUALITY PROTEIN: olfactory receptor 5AS1-like [Morus bassanus]
MAFREALTTGSGNELPEDNCTTLTEFILLGFTNCAGETSLFGLFLLIHTTTLVGNAGLMVLIQLNACLHTPMYYFLSNLSFFNLGCSSAISPKVLVNLLAQQETISLTGCGTQMFLFAAFAYAEYLILAAMAYDHYMPICHPLLYTVAMSCRVCTSMVAGAYLSRGLTSLVHVFHTHCGSNVINHFFCDIPPLLELPCSNTHISEVVLFALLIQTSTFLTIVVSCASILSAVLWIHVADSRHKAFYTCSSYLTAIGLFYGSILFTYLQPSVSYSLDTTISAFYTVVFRMLKPLIYSLRNKLVKDALRRTLKRGVFSQ